MKHEINIYGDIVPFKWLKDGSEFDRADLNASIDSLDLQEGDELIYNIHTFGGCTTTAFSMYNKLKRVKNEKKITLTSRADGYCASSGVILLLAADKRIGSKYLKPFVHNAWTFKMGDKNEMLKIYEELDAVDNAISELYSEETSITKEEAQNLMNENRDLTLDECMEFGFYSELENVKVVEVEEVFNSIISRRQNLNNNMNTEKKTLWNQLQKDINALFGGSASTKNKIVFTAENAELDFYELAEEDTPKIGDKAKYDGKPAGDSNGGEYTMPSGETFKFTGEELTEIVPKAEESTVEDLKTENAELAKEIENLKTQVSNLIMEKTKIENSLNQSKELIKNLQDFAKPDENEDDDKRDPKAPVDEPKKSRVKSAFNKLKSKK